MQGASSPGSIGVLLSCCFNSAADSLRLADECGQMMFLQRDAHATAASESGKWRKQYSQSARVIAGAGVLSLCIAGTVSGGGMCVTSPEVVTSCGPKGATFSNPNSVSTLASLGARPVRAVRAGPGFGRASPPPPRPSCEFGCLRGPGRGGGALPA